MTLKKEIWQEIYNIVGDSTMTDQICQLVKERLEKDKLSEEEFDSLSWAKRCVKIINKTDTLITELSKE